MRSERLGKDANVDAICQESPNPEERGDYSSELNGAHPAVIEVGWNKKTLLLDVSDIDGTVLERLSEVFDIVRPSEDVEEKDIDYILIDGRIQSEANTENVQKDAPSEMADITCDKEFLSRAREVVWRNIDNVDFNKSVFAAEMYVSQSLLYKKIKSLTGMPIVGFVKSIRMEHALVLLSDSSLSITEISERCGFASVSYFGEIFRTQFGK